MLFFLRYSKLFWCKSILFPDDGLPQAISHTSAEENACVQRRLQFPARRPRKHTAKEMDTIDCSHDYMQCSGY